MDINDKIKNVINELGFYVNKGGSINNTLLSSIMINNKLPLNKKNLSIIQQELGKNNITIEDGMIDEESDDVSIKPFDYSKINLESKILTMQNIINRLECDEIVLNPEFQRNEVWGDVKKSRLIESIFLNIPLPSFYFDASNPEQWIIVDGLQRLSAIRDYFVEKKLRLCGLEYLDLNGKKYDEVPPSFNRRALERNVNAIFILPGTPIEIKFNIFKRINTGGVVLSMQEIRNALMPTKVRRVLEKFSLSAEFKKATNYSISNTRMLDKEFILRFLSFRVNGYESYENYNSLEDFLTMSCDKIDNLDESEINNIYNDFLKSMRTNFMIFGKNAFRKISNENQNRTNPINKGLFDCFSVIVSKKSKEECEMMIEKKEKIVNRLIDELDVKSSSRLRNSISSASVAAVKSRFECIEKIIKDVITSD